MKDDLETQALIQVMYSVKHTGTVLPKHERDVYKLVQQARSGVIEKLREDILKNGVLHTARKLGTVKPLPCLGLPQESRGAKCEHCLINSFLGVEAKKQKVFRLK